MSASSLPSIVVLGASAGGVGVMTTILSGMSSDIDAFICVTMHRGAAAPSYLADVLLRRSRLAVSEPRHGEKLVRGVVYLAPADRHMRVDGGTIALDRGAKQHHTRPAIDPLFQSAAESFGRRAIGVLLSGNLSDGVAGLVAIKERGGKALVQDPREAEWSSMPRNALLYDHVDLVFRAGALPTLLARLVAGDSIADVARSARRSKHDDL